MATSESHPIEELGFVLIGSGLLVAIGVLAYQGIQWLRLAVWTPLPLALAWDAASIPRPHVTWLGVQTILDWVLDLPLSFLSLGVVLIGFLLVSVGVVMHTARLPGPGHKG